VRVATGEGVLNTIWHTYGIMERYTPSVLPAMRAARQQQNEIRFEAMNAVHVPIALASMALLPLIMLFALWRRSFREVGLLAFTVMLAILANAVVCGALSNAHDRYGSRIIWLAPLVAVLVPLRRRSPIGDQGPRYATPLSRAAA
jgi:hypothetical protein